MLLDVTWCWFLEVWRFFWRFFKPIFLTNFLTNSFDDFFSQFLWQILFFLFISLFWPPKFQKEGLRIPQLPSNEGSALILCTTSYPINAAARSLFFSFFSDCVMILNPCSWKNWPTSWAWLSHKTLMGQGGPENVNNSLRIPQHTAGTSCWPLLLFFTLCSKFNEMMLHSYEIK